jgi:hypothetical protein
MPRTPHRVIDKEPFGEWTAVVRTDGANCEKLIAAAREQHGLLADVPHEHAAVGKFVDGDSLREVGAGRK